MHVADQMTMAPVTVMPGHSVRHAAQILLDYGLCGVPVVDGEVGLVGILTEGDLLRRFEYGVSGARPYWIETGSPEGAARAFVKSRSWRVGDVMSKPVVTVKEDTSLV